MNAVEVRGVSKYYTLADTQWSRLQRIFSPVYKKQSSAGSEIRALDNISFHVAPGEALGIIGSNGSGKSTLLQIVAGILKPTSGTVELSGRCSTLLELGSGFAPEFTGRQNVYLNATILGLTNEAIEEEFEAIHRFSGIGDFIDQPIRTYSSGMVLRLAFAVVAHSDPKILIVDEALAVGDVAFRQRCMRRIHELRAAGVTILFVSHDAGDVKALCERCLWLDKGVMRGIGEADEVVAGYLASTLDRGSKAQTRSADISHAIAEPLPGTHRFGNRKAEVRSIALPPLHAGGEMLLRLQIRALHEVTAPIAGFLVRNEKGETIFGTNSARENHPLAPMDPDTERSIDFRITMPRLASGRYNVSVAVSDGSIAEFDVCDYIEDAIAFTIEPASRAVEGYLELPCNAVAIHRG